jgi:hypothetical protein
MKIARASISALRQRWSFSANAQLPETGHPVDLHFGRDGKTANGSVQGFQLDKQAERLAFK